MTDTKKDCRKICKTCGTREYVSRAGYCLDCLGGLDQVALGRTLAAQGASYTTRAYVHTRIPRRMTHADIARALGWYYVTSRSTNPQADVGRVKARFFTGESVKTALLVDLLIALGEHTRDIGPLRIAAKYHCPCGEPLETPALECGFCAEQGAMVHEVYAA